jgi:hypothetical protein
VVADGPRIFVLKAQGETILDFSKKKSHLTKKKKKKKILPEAT